MRPDAAIIHEITISGECIHHGRVEVDIGKRIVFLYDESESYTWLATLEDMRRIDEMQANLVRCAIQP